ncbi:MAG TPA: tail fiber domain-containing protein [Thermoanaerobaculia bacterium]|nr:tail fiber domain-containing protein [Thermoanaerobaculia bacterium]
MVATPSTIEWQTAASHDAIVLTISGPNDFSFTKSFSGNAFIRLQDLGLQPGGTYTYDLRLVPHISAAVRKQLADSREAGDQAVTERIRAGAGLDAAPYQSGAFSVANGAFISPDLQEPAAPGKPVAATMSTTGASTSANRAIPGAKIQDVVTADDVIIQGSACIGLDCVNNESFGFDTIRLKENNTRIKFNDTSVSPFPNTNWQLTANDSSSGGANKFSIDDVTNSKTPFTVTASSPTNSLFIASTGKVGFGNSSPGLNLHVTATDTPAFRMEQTNGGGFTAQTWDIGANEANWFVRDLTGGSRLPFRIRPGAPTSSIDVQANGNVGIGTASAQRALDIQTTLAGGVTDRKQNFSATGFAGTEYLDNAGNVDLFFGIDNAGNNVRLNAMNSNPIIVYFDGSEKFRFTSTGLGIGAVPSNPIQHSSGAILTAGGVWQNASSRALKEDIRDLDADAAMAAFRKLEPVTYNYKVDPKEHHVGFIAEDVPDLVAAKDHKSLSPLDIVALLTKVVQQQQQTIDELSAKVSAMEKKQ